MTTGIRPAGLGNATEQPSQNVQISALHTHLHQHLHLQLLHKRDKSVALEAKETVITLPKYTSQLCSFPEGKRGG